VAVSSFSNSGIKSGSKRNKIWDQSAVDNSFFSIATVSVGSGGVADVTFNNIPQTYTHLQIRCLLKYAVSGDTLFVQINDETSNYTFHRLSGNGSSASSAASTPRSQWIAGSDIPSATSTFGVSIIDILDYTNTNKNKTIKVLCGHETNSAGVIELKSGTKFDYTNAITKIKLYPTAGNFSEYSHIALYGIKG
jgi:hypothetical protein